MTQSTDSPEGVQFIVHGPGSQVGVQVPPEISQWKLQLVPEQLMVQSRASRHPEWHT